MNADHDTGDGKEEETERSPKISASTKSTRSVEAVGT